MVITVTDVNNQRHVVNLLAENEYEAVDQIMKLAVVQVDRYTGAYNYVVTKHIVKIEVIEKPHGT